MKDIEVVRAESRERIKRYREGHPEYVEKWNNKNKSNIIKKPIVKEPRKRRKRGCIRNYTRIEAMKMISNELKCLRCGCNDIKILEINHKNGGGTKEIREEFKKNCITFHRAICLGKRTIEDLELLCKLCNIHHYIQDILGITGHKVTYSST